MHTSMRLNVLQSPATEGLSPQLIVMEVSSFGSTPAGQLGFRLQAIGMLLSALRCLQIRKEW
jgi:hypothetical protein